MVLSFKAAGIDRDAEARARNIGKEAARRAGLTEVEIKKLYADVRRRQKETR